MNGPPPTIVCVECGGEAHLISFLPDDEPLAPGQPVAYRCEDCAERLDMIWEEDD